MNPDDSSRLLLAGVVRQNPTVRDAPASASSLTDIQPIAFEAIWRGLFVRS